MLVMTTGFGVTTFNVCPNTAMTNCMILGKSLSPISSLNWLVTIAAVWEWHQDNAYKTLSLAPSEDSKSSKAPGAILSLSENCPCYYFKRSNTFPLWEFYTSDLRKLNVSHILSHMHVMQTRRDQVNKRSRKKELVLTLLLANYSKVKSGAGVTAFGSPKPAVSLGQAVAPDCLCSCHWCPHRDPCAVWFWALFLAAYPESDSLTLATIWTTEFSPK